MKKQLNEKNYIAVADWMITELNLSSRELLIYAIIYGFSQDGESRFSGSLNYLCSWLNVSDRNNLRRTLNSLIEKGLIHKETHKLNDKQICCSYMVTEIRGETKTYDHIFISPWMIHGLGLRDKELILYALIYGYSRIGSNSYCQASTEYFGKWIGVQKNHVKERYLKKMIENGLIKVIESSTENTKYIAIVPAKLLKDDVSQNDHTFPNCNRKETEDSQNDHTQSHFDYINRPKMTTNNLVNNLKNNLVINNNRINDYEPLECLTKEVLSVVVNKEIPMHDFTIEMEKTVLVYKQNHDYELYKKYYNKNPYLPEIMKVYALSNFRMLLARWPSIKPTCKAEELLIEVLCSPKFKDRQKQILNIEKEKIKELFEICQELFEPENPRDIRKGKKAYMIGVLEIMLQET